MPKEEKCVKECAEAHQSSGGNYEWLEPYFGKVLKVEFKEPPSAKKWQKYNKKWWEVHCDVIKHDPKHLVQDHVKSFINPKTRIIKLRFTFNLHGIVYQTEPIKKFYELERDFFEKNKLCH